MNRKTTRIILIVLVIILILSFLGYRAMQPVHVSLERFDSAPLGALAEIKTRKPTQVHLLVRGRDGNDLQKEFSGYSEHHKIPILGLYPDYENQIELTMQTRDGKRYTREVAITTDPLPEDYPEIKINRRLPDRIAEGMIFMHAGHYDADGDFQSFPSAVDEYGRVRWLYSGEIGHVLKRLDSGNFLIQRDDPDAVKGQLHGAADRLLEIDMLGRTEATRAEVQTGIHHDASVMPNGNILILTSAPGSYDDGVVEVDGTTGQLLQGWDLREILDPDRPPQPRNLEADDWLHLNGIDYSPVDDSFILSARDQSAVVKIDRESGDLIWILGNHKHWDEQFQPYLLTPVIDEHSQEFFEWPWGQHAPMFTSDDPNQILVYDNGNDRSYEDPLDPRENYSRAVEYRIDPESMTVRQIWEFGRRYASKLYTPFIGDANYLPNGNRLVCFGGITRSLSGEPMEIFDFEAGEVRRMKISARILEVASDYPAQEVLSITLADDDKTSYRGYRSYRAIKLPLYPQ
ncbi:MAG: aryl-sulfate sulfotransferase [Spirochaetota bacterium]